ncbi:VOC family protein [Myroides pelagicus]|uniref:VOC family protein n=1 Tax=Myroides pelagicus TaxID=270914 RepID=A0A7K1GKX8_9FLAO|nr:VOC family protein [Myroides pelagicus]MTH29189.1 VOC family protein [Myroides pelagicus]
MATTNTYLTFEGTCEQAFTFYRSVFGGEFTYIARFSDIPPSEEFFVEEGDKDKIMHVSLPIGQSVLMGSDNSCANPVKFIQGNNFSVSVIVQSKQEANDIFQGLSDGATIVMPLADMFWGDYYGMLVDKFGIQWMVNFSNEQ